MALWTPAEITTSLWLDADDASTISIATGVSQWRDKSGLDRHASQATTTKQPALSVAALNGKNVITFDGASDALATVSFAAPVVMSAFVVMSSAQITDGVIFEHSVNYNNYYHTNIFMVRSGPDAGATVHHGSGTNQYASTRFSGRGTSPCVEAMLYDGGSSTDLFQNGTQLAETQAYTVTGSGTSSSYPYYIGARGGTSLYYNGDIAEIIFIFGAPSIEVRQKIEGYLAWKWGLEDNLPAEHPYKSEAPIIALECDGDVEAPIPVIDSITINYQPAQVDGDFHVPLSSVSSYAASANHTITARSVVIDIADNWGGDQVGIRSIDFYLLGELVVQTDTGETLGIATSQLSTNYNGTKAFLTNLDKVGYAYDNSWLSYLGYGTNQRLILYRYNSPIVFDQIVVNNFHNNGDDTNKSAKNIVVTTTLDLYSTTTYNAIVTNGAVIFEGQLGQHVASNAEDSQTIFNISFQDIDINVDFVTTCEISGITENANAPEPSDIDVSFESPLSAISGVTLNSAPVPFVFLVQSEHPDGDKDFFDVAKNLPVHATGDVRHVTNPIGTTPYFGDSCIMLTSLFHGPSDGVLYTDETVDFAFGTGDFTIDFWFYQIYPATNGQFFWMSGSPTGLNKPAIALERVNIGNDLWMTFSGMSSGPVGYHDLTPGMLWDSFAWYHLAWDRRDGVSRICRGGAVLYEVVDTTDYDGRILNIGNNNCLIEELRVSRYSRWGGTFTPDTEPFVAEDTTSASFKTLLPNISAIVWNHPPPKTYVNGQPWINQYNFNTTNPTNFGTFVQGEDFPVAISRRMSLVNDEFAYIIGGTTTYYAARNSDGTVGTWMTTTGLTVARVGGQLFETYKRVFIAGGYEYGQPVRTVLTAPVNSDGSLGEWTNTFPMTSTRADFALSITRNRVYALGGFVDGEIGGFVTDTYEYAPINYAGTIGAWEFAGNMPNARDRCFSICTGPLLYIIGGGLLADPLNTDVVYVSDEGVIIEPWTTEEWYGRPACAFVCSATRLFMLGGIAGNFSVDEIHSRDITAGVISDGTADFRGYLPDEVHSPTVFLTDEKIYIIGGISTDIDDNWITLTTTGVATFSGIDVDFALYTSVEEETAIPIGGSIIAPAVEIQSYFGYGSLAFGDVSVPVPTLDGITRYTEFINGDVIAPLPEIYSITHFWRYIDTEFVAPLPEVYGSSGAMISGGVAAPVPDIKSYVVRVYFMTDFRTQLPVISLSVSNPIAINGDIKVVHPHFNSTFQTISNFHAPAPSINAVTDNPYAIIGNYISKPPIVNSLFSNPELITCSFAPKVTKINGTAFEVPYIITNIKSKVPSISSYVDEGPIRISGNFVPQHPTIHGEFVMSDDYVLIKYRENRLCRL